MALYSHDVLWEGIKDLNTQKKPNAKYPNPKWVREIRNRDERKCIICGKCEIINGRRMSIHHIDGDKMQGCNGAKWRLCALCHSCNSRPDTIEKEFLIVSNQHYKH